ncbi:ferrochelatase [Neolewinella antarctica]|uniref:Ferrochelatase n=1 Tax=Neolewinella antarctica TaxID=442734 RepID=A0ABX0X947_9BACT|nr:ferrochelatase [Neolewinella antarctica]NJC25751.1 ferrochelatase [Neolewinella antarctica]
MHVQEHFGKKGVLLVNLGTPDAPTPRAVNRYLGEFLTDPRVIDNLPGAAQQVLVRGIIAPIRSGIANPFKTGGSTKLYQELWTENGSPLKYYGEILAKEVAKSLGDEYEVRLAMRYQNPSIASALKELLDAGVSSVTIFPLFPQYASATTGSVHQEVMRLLSKEQLIPNVNLVNSYYENPALIKVFADNARDMGGLDDYDHIIFSYHGLPQRQLKKGDPSDCYCYADGTSSCCHSIQKVNQFCYSAQCFATTRAIAAELGLAEERYTTSFQSRLGFDDWAKPYTIDTLEDLAKEKGAKRLLCFSPAFVSDCLETTIEIGLEYQEEFEEWGGEHIDLVPSLNDDPRWIAAVVEMIRVES